MAQKHHIILFPLMTRGHYIPFLALARLLEQRTPYTITVVSTPINVQGFRSSLTSNTRIRLAQLPFNSSDHGLPPNTETTDSLPYHLILRLTIATESLRPHFEQLISDISNSDGHPPLSIVADIYFGWTVEIANKMGIFHSVFFGQGVYPTAVYVSIWQNLPHRRIDSDEFTLPDFPSHVTIHRTQLSNHLKTADGSDLWTRFLWKQLTFCYRSDGLLFNSVAELENTGLKYFREKTNRPVWTIGPVASQLTSVKETRITVDPCLEWLSLHRPCSVLYISFGSQNSISVSQMMELAKGLEESGTAFIWVIRNPIGFEKVGGEFKPEWLPEEFEDRMAEKKQGILVKRWAQQMEILSHESTGAFLSHCGWNSVMESLGCGIPIIGWPISAEQFYNSKMLEEEVGACVEIARGNCSEVMGHDIAGVIGMVMGETKKAKELRERAGEIREIIKAASRDEDGLKGSSVKALDDFIGRALSMGT